MTRADGGDGSALRHQQGKVTAEEQPTPPLTLAPPRSWAARPARAALRSGRPSPPPSGQVAARRAARAGPKGGQGRARGRPTGPPSRPDHSVCEMRGQLENGGSGERGPIFAHFFWRVREICTFPAAPWPSAASPVLTCPPPPPQAHQRPPPARKSHQPLTRHRFLLAP